MRILSPVKTCMADPLYYSTRMHDRSGGGGGGILMDEGGLNQKKVCSSKTSRCKGKNFQKEITSVTTVWKLFRTFATFQAHLLSHWSLPLNKLLPEVHANGDVSVLPVHLWDAKDVPVHGHCNHHTFFTVVRFHVINNKYPVLLHNGAAWNAYVRKSNLSPTYAPYNNLAS